MVDFGKKLSLILVEKSMTQKDLAYKIGKSQSQISQYTSGKVGVPFETVDKIAKSLDIDISYFSSEKYKSNIEELPQANEDKTKYSSTLIDTSILENKLESMRRDIDMLKSKIL